MKKRDRRKQLLAHAARLFGEKGYHNTSISDVIASSNVARGTFYLYFASKRTLFEELVDSLLLRIVACIQPVEVGPGAVSPRTQLVDNLVRVFVLLGEERHLLSILLRGAVGLDGEIDDKLRDFYHQVESSIKSSLSLGQQMGLVRSCDINVAASAGLGAIKEILQRALVDESMLDSAGNLQRLAGAILDLFSVGVLNDGVTLP